MCEACLHDWGLPRPGCKLSAFVNFEPSLHPGAWGINMGNSDGKVPGP
jgi:hypothetical protein